MKKEPLLLSSVESTYHSEMQCASSKHKRHSCSLSGGDVNNFKQSGIITDSGVDNMQ